MDTTTELLYSRETLELLKSDPQAVLFDLRAKRRDPVHYQALAAELHGHLGQVLDIGCGPGRFAFHLAKRADHTVGLDISPLLLRLAQERQRASAQTNLSWVLGDAHALPFPIESFDVITSTHALGFTDLPHVLSQIKVLLKPGGQFLLCLSHHRETIQRCYPLSSIRSALNFVPEVMRTFGPGATLRYLRFRVHSNSHGYYPRPHLGTQAAMQEICGKLIPDADIVITKHQITVNWTKPK